MVFATLRPTYDIDYLMFNWTVIFFHLPEFRVVRVEK